MSFYAEWLLPPLIDLSMRNKHLRPYRERAAGAAEGRVLDVGIGSGLNLPFYSHNAHEIFGLDPSLAGNADLLLVGNDATNRLCVTETAIGADDASDDVADRHAIAHLRNRRVVVLAEHLERAVLELGACGFSAAIVFAA